MVVIDILIVLAFINIHWKLVGVSHHARILFGPQEASAVAQKLILCLILTFFCALLSSRAAG